MRLTTLDPVPGFYIPPTSVSSERFFSEADFLNKPYRNRLHGEKFLKLLFFKFFNIPLLQFNSVAACIR